MNEIAVDEKDEIFWYQNPSLLAKDLIRAKQAKNEQLVNNINDELIDLKNTIIKNEISADEHPKFILLKKSLTLINSEKVKDTKY